MKILKLRFLIICGLAMMGGCTTGPAATPEGIPSASKAAEPPSVDFSTKDFPEARSHALTTGPDGALYFIYGQEQSLFVARSTDGGLTFDEPVLATGDIPVHVLPIEHPAIAVGEGGQVAIAWLEMPPDFHGAKVWYAASEDGGGTFEPGQLVTTESEGEVAMVQLALDGVGNPILVWLNDSELKFSRSLDEGRTFSQAVSIGDGSCECCQPQSMVIGHDIYVAYRGLEKDKEKGDIRDIVMIRSNDSGKTFQPVTRVSDTHWYLPACPIAGPSMAVRDGNFYISWMDGRFQPPGTFRRGDIWLASSRDEGQSFSANLRINFDQEMHHTLPSIAIGPGGRIHIAWEVQAQRTREAFLYYTTSDDGGQSFAPPQIIANNSDSTRGSPGKPVITADGTGHITLAWLDRLGVRMAVWTDTR